MIAAAVAAMSVSAGCGIIGGGSPTDNALDELSVSSPRFRDQAPLPAEFTCTGQSGNPPLRWSGVPPKQTKSIALVVDANNAQGAAAVHWVLFNIDPHTTELGQDSVPKGASQAQTSTGKPGYAPPCAQDAVYRFSVYALNAELSLKNDADLRATLDQIAQHTVARGRLSAAHIE
ncbi:hypothetical protein Sme01_07470 [Sphaerisporangium melleum]|uniref:YbhB/YbcL family Raf kinase inhibitor-like protein n=1 Tax=Sphaerisporangium melleum TaxID=321316 RepID=A0A917VG31_9ACTN|nr:hypothetical protein GCM10007964_14730 [Sphaerisporangium melleum]GII68271.1 hypothetical protein Sme01_07470 [Sphaerisporangium melleum]